MEEINYIKTKKRNRNDYKPNQVIAYHLHEHFFLEQEAYQNICRKKMTGLLNNVKYTVRYSVENHEFVEV
jgi:hypothetical protein